MDELSYWLNFDPLPAQPVRSEGRSRARHMATRSGGTQATAIPHSYSRSAGARRSLGSPNARYQPRHRTEPSFGLPGLAELPHLPALTSPGLPHPSLNKFTEPAIIAGSVVALVGVTAFGMAGHTSESDSLTTLAAEHTSHERASRDASLAERYPGAFDPTTTTATPETTIAPTTVPPTTAPVTEPPKPTTTVAPKPKPKDSGPAGDDVWQKLANCEAGGRNDTGAPYYGYFQFSAQTWKSVGGTGLPSDHDYETQKALAKKLQERSGWGQWPSCSSKLGLR